MRQQQLASSSLSLFDDGLYVVDTGKRIHVFLNAAEAKAKGFEGYGEILSYINIPCPSPTCRWSKKAKKYTDRLYGGPLGDLVGLKDINGILNLFDDHNDALLCQPNTERRMQEHVLLYSEGFNLSDVVDYPDAILSPEAKRSLEIYEAKLAAKSANSKGTKRSAKARKAK